MEISIGAIVIMQLNLSPLQRPLLLFFVQVGEWEEVKSKPGEKGIWKRAGDNEEGQRKKRGPFFHFCVFRLPPPPLTEPLRRREQLY